MKITFDDAMGLLKGIDDPLWFSQEICKAAKIATETMRKYQKIEEIVKAWNDMNSFDSMKQISEVLEDGSESNYHASNS